MRFPTPLVAAAFLVILANPARAYVPLPTLAAPDAAAQADLARTPAPAPARPVARPAGPKATGGAGQRATTDWSPREGDVLAPMVVVSAAPAPVPAGVGRTRAFPPLEAGLAEPAVAMFVDGWEAPAGAKRSDAPTPMRARWQAYQAALRGRDARALAALTIPKFASKAVEGLEPSHPDRVRNWRTTRQDLLAGTRFLSEDLYPIAPGTPAAAVAQELGIRVRPGDGTMLGTVVLEGTHAEDNGDWAPKGSAVRLKVDWWRVRGRWLKGTATKLGGG